MLGIPCYWNLQCYLDDCILQARHTIVTANTMNHTVYSSTVYIGIAMGGPALYIAIHKGIFNLNLSSRWRTSNCMQKIG